MTWYYAYNQDLWPVLISVVLIIFLGFFSWHRRTVPGARAFAIGCLFALLWVIGSGLEIAALDFQTKVFWLRFHALWQIPTVTALGCFFLEYAGFGRFLTRRNLILLSLPAMFIFGLMVTNDLHHLIWTSFAMDEYPFYGLISRRLTIHSVFPSGSRTRKIVSNCGFVSPHSSLAMTGCFTPLVSSSIFCDMPACLLTSERCSMS